MNEQEAFQQQAAQAGPLGAGESPADRAAAGAAAEQEMRAVYEEQLRTMDSSELLLQSTVTLLNLAALRLGLAEGDEAERDMEQARDCIDAVRALVEILGRRASAGQLDALRGALAQLQMAYSQLIGQAPEAAAAAGQGGPDQPGAEASPGAPGGAAVSPEQPAGPRPTPSDGGSAGAPEQRPGPAQSSGRLWVPGQS